MQKSEFIKKWEIACEDLGFEMTAPYEVDVGDAKKLNIPIFLKDFGGKSGMLIVTQFDEIEPHRAQLFKLGYGYSTVSQSKRPAAESYDRETFIEMLSDWGWSGDPSKKPGWIIQSKEE